MQNSVITHWYKECFKFHPTEWVIFKLTQDKTTEFFITNLYKLLLFNLYTEERKA